MTTMTREEKMPSQYLHRKSSQILQDRKEITDFTKSYTNFEQYGKQKMRANLTHCLKISISTRLYGSVQSLSHVQLFVTPWTAARQASLSITNSKSLLKLIFIELVMPSISSSVVPFSSCLQSFPASGSIQWVSSSYQVAYVLEFQLEHQSFQWIFRTDFL